MATINVNMYYIGNLTDVDPNESNFAPESPSDLVGILATSPASGGILELVAVANNDGNNDGAISDNEVPASSADTVSYTHGGVAYSNIQADTTVTGNVLVTLHDGSTQTIEAVIIQMDNGDVFVTDLLNAGTLDDLAIQSIQITSLTWVYSSGYFANQSVDNGQVVCFASGTRIETDRGLVAVEDLSAGDLVRTRDNGLQPVRWSGSVRVEVGPLTGNEKLRPIRIRAGALGDNTPSTDLLVSPQHRVLIRSVIAQRMFCADEVLVAARQLCQIDGIDIAQDVKEVAYFHILFDRHEVVFSNGAETESLYTGPEALKAISPAAREEIFALFPELADREYTPQAARVLATGRMGRKLAARHAQNNKMLVN